MVWSVLSKISSTVAWDTGLRAEEPEKMTSVSESPRRCLAEISPMTQRTASMMLDLPQPFGPTTPIRLEGKLTAVGSTNDLKPASLILLSRIAPGFLQRFGGGRRAVVYVKAAGVWTRAKRPARRVRCPVPARRRLYNRAPLLRSTVSHVPT